MLVENGLKLVGERGEVVVGGWGWGWGAIIGNNDKVCIMDLKPGRHTRPRVKKKNFFWSFNDGSSSKLSSLYSLYSIAC